MISQRTERWIWAAVSGVVAGVILVIVATAGCGRPFLRCSELEIGAAADGGADAGDER